jgi:hypothetical protein
MTNVFKIESTEPVFDDFQKRVAYQIYKFKFEFCDISILVSTTIVSDIILERFMLTAIYGTFYPSVFGLRYFGPNHSEVRWGYSGSDKT